MADFIFKPSGNASGNFGNALEFEGFDADETVTVAGGTYDIYQKVVSGFAVQAISAQFDVTSVGEEPVITVTAGNVSITIGAGDYAGTYTQRVTDGATLTVAMIDAGPTPVILPTVSGTLDLGETLAINAGLWLFSGDDPGDQAWQQLLDGVDIPGGTGLTYEITNAANGTDFTVGETFGSVTIESAVTAISFTTTNPTVPFAVTQIGGTGIGGIQGKIASGPPAQYNAVDLSAYDAGTQFLIINGTSRAASAATIDGVAATKLTNDADYGSGLFLNAFVATLTGVGSASAPITVTLSSDTSVQFTSIWAIEGGVVDGVDSDSLNFGSRTGTVTPTSATNAIIGAICSNGATGFAWSGGMTETYDAANSIHRIGFARADNVAVAVTSPSVSLDNNAASSFVAVSISEAS